MINKYQLIIVGAGLVGLTAALAACRKGYKVALVGEQLAQFKNDSHAKAAKLRVVALNQASINAYANLNVWPLISANVGIFQNMQVWDQNSTGQLAFSAKETEYEQLGAIVNNLDLAKSVYQQLQDEPLCEFVTANAVKVETDDQSVWLQVSDGKIMQGLLLLAADGRHSALRSMLNIPCWHTDYAQDAIVAEVTTDLPHQQIARQIFTPEGPLAFLPLADTHRCSIVWSLDKSKAQQVMQLSNRAFAKHLTATFDGVLGYVELASERVSFPLKGHYAKSFVHNRCVLVGDAAHTIHPLAGQGANLGLLDVFYLLDSLPDVMSQLGDRELVKIRQQMRGRQAEAIENLAVMQAFKEGFSMTVPPLKMLRSLALNTVAHLKPLQRAFIRRALGPTDTGPSLCQSWPDKRL
ncbi:FAD-dependent oxidoreductase [Gayadomonas joobiniege]|uniref:FAD-dependent oxidoreductase n=1 Tax=Gayadomonas joobiniege TaxID=1234606 RepID=UPI000380C7B4|nr:FAD-dependent oxidoreductase [Gayadomonas joobiniege]